MLHYWLIVVSVVASAAASDDDPRPCKVPSNNATDFPSPCSRCSAGQGIQMFCSQKRSHTSPSTWCYLDTLCSECMTGTYQDKANHSEGCSICGTCNKAEGLVVVAECSRTSNTVCGCSPNSYLDKQQKRCTRCKQCQPGFQPSGCTGELDTTCTQCANGTFSNGQDSCKPCSKCGPEQSISAECTAHQDTECLTKVRVPLVRGSDNSNVNTPSEESSSGNLMIFLSCGMMALVVVSVVCYALWKHCEKPDKKRAVVTGDHGDQSMQPYVYESKRHHGPSETSADKSLLADKATGTVVVTLVTEDRKPSRSPDTASIARTRDETLQVLVDSRHI